MAMTENSVLTYLQATFPEQTILYAKDMSKLLSRSEKAISHMLNRGQLPFKVKKIGGRWCTDIFSVQHWLEADGIALAPEEGRPRKKAKTESLAAKSPKEGRVSLAGRLMEMRHARALDMRRFAEHLAVEAGRAFVLEIVGCMLFPRKAPDAEFVVMGTRYAMLPAAVECDERKFFLESMGELAACVWSLKSEWNDADAVKIVIKAGKQKLYESFRFSGSDWVAIKDELDIG